MAAIIHSAAYLAVNKTRVRICWGKIITTGRNVAKKSGNEEMLNRIGGTQKTEPLKRSDEAPC